MTSAHKVVLCGRTNVGKTTLIMHFIRGMKPDQKCLSTIGADFFLYKHNIGDDTVRLHLWDTAGAERFNCVQPFVFRDARAIMFVYDITDADSFAAMETILGQALDNVGDIDPWVVIVGNKVDLAAEKRAVRLSKATEMCRQLNYTLIETSAHDGTNVQRVLDMLCETLHERFGEKKSERKESRAPSLSTGKTIDLSAPPPDAPVKQGRAKSACEC